MGTSYIDTYEKQLNERKFALLRTLAAWWIATSKGKGEEEARGKVLAQIEAMRTYLDGPEAIMQRAEVHS